MNIQHSQNLNFIALRQQDTKSKLNLVALMDIFTILVFFLLLNAGDSDRLENAKFVKLPESSASASPHVEAMIMIDDEKIWLNDDLVMTVEDALKSTEETLSPLQKALGEYSERKEELTAYEKENGFAVTIMGDKSVSFSLLKSVMATCSDANFRDISLAVNRVAPQDFLLTSNAQTPTAGVQAGGL